ncbi:HNH endonuclease [Natrialbaceae archaeon A-chndr2]
MDKQSQFELGMTVHDRHSPFPDDAVVVNLPNIPINKFTAYPDGEEKVTVAEDNPGYDPQQKVVVVVYQSDLDVFGGEYTGKSPISFNALSRNDIPHYGFPPQRLVPDDLRYNTDPPESVGVPLIGESQFIQRKQLELAIIDRVAGGSNNRIAKTDEENEINVGPAPADIGESIYIIPLSDSASSDEAKFGICVINLDTDEIGDFSPTDYLDSIISNSNLSSAELKEQLSYEIDLNNVDQLVEYFESRNTHRESKNLEKDSQPVCSSEEISNTEDNDPGGGKIQKGDQYQNAGHTESDSESKKTTAEQDLEELRSEARASGSEDPSKSEIEYTRQQTQEYTRTPKVREYVKQRAGGICEGCGESAPFTSKTGDPYLHAHHINELSDSGEDTIESVIALCPNCHYRVHHGQDGEEYNEELLKIVCKLEDVE